MWENWAFWYKLMTCKDIKGTIGRSIGEDKASSKTVCQYLTLLSLYFHITYLIVIVDMQWVARW
jgi:hypothetical protein